MSKTTRSYNQRASTYEQRWEAYLQHTHESFLRHLNLSRSDRILDLSCGTGLLAQMILDQGQPFDLLILNDPAEAMLDIARQRLHGRPRIGFSGAPAHQLPFEDNSFSQLLSLSAFHNYFNQTATTAEIRRVLKADGVVLLLDWNRSGLFRPVNALIRWRVPERIDTRSLAECRQLLEQQDFFIEHQESWYYRYWKFFLIKARLTADS